jgi:glycosyltransferase involved in cell wall biosynthesis
VRKKFNRKYFIQEHFFTEQVCHGGIGCKDIEEVLRRNHFQPIQFPSHFDFSVKAKLVRIIFLIKTVLFLPSDAVLFFQAPLYAKANQLLVKAILRLRKSIKVVCFITDIDGLRDGNDSLLKKEKKFFRRFTYFIVHNNTMKEWVRAVKPTAIVSIVEFFDFLTVANKKIRAKNFSVAFSGNTINSTFIFDLSKIRNIEFHLYGEMDNTRFNKFTNLNFYGLIDSKVLKDQIKGSFGLVWNGNSINSLTGSTGDYLKINSPHKLSSYIVSGLPVIVHESSAAASLVKKYGIGFTIRSLNETAELVEQIRQVEYESMQKNCFCLANKISTGKCLEDALKELNFL